MNIPMSSVENKFLDKRLATPPVLFRERYVPSILAVEHNSNNLLCLISLIYENGTEPRRGRSGSSTKTTRPAASLPYFHPDHAIAAQSQFCPSKKHNLFCFRDSGLSLSGILLHLGMNLGACGG
jgi:hypothetical protein